MGIVQMQNLKHLNHDVAYIKFLDNWRRRWNIARGGPHIGSMLEIILEREDRVAEFVTNFTIYVISTCIIENPNSTCHFLLLKYMKNLDNIKNYNWCAFFIQCVNDIVIEW